MKIQMKPPFTRKDYSAKELKTPNGWMINGLKVYANKKAALYRTCLKLPSHVNKEAHRK